jgi:lysophospholipase L1-like esterase
MSVGGNDLFGDQLSKFESVIWPSMMMTRTIARLDRLVREIHRLNPAARVYLLGLYNPYQNTSLAAFLDRQVALWDSRLIAHFAGQPAVDVIRIADLFAYVSRLSPIDHFHPGHQGYALIAQRIAMTF